MPCRLAVRHYSEAHVSGMKRGNEAHDLLVLVFSIQERLPPTLRLHHREITRALICSLEFTPMALFLWLYHSRKGYESITVAQEIIKETQFPH